MTHFKLIIINFEMENQSCFEGLTSSCTIQGVVLTTLVTLNAIAGIIIFENAWIKTYRVRHPNSELAKIFPAYQRTDALKWKKWHFYPGAATLLVPRLIFIILGGVSLLLFVNLAMIGQDREKPIVGLRKKLTLMLYKVHIHAMMLVSF